MLEHRYGKGEDRVKKKREVKSAYKQVIDDLLFEAGTTAMLARQADGMESYSRYEGLSKDDLRVKFQKQALLLVMKATFVCRRSGIDESKLHKAVDLAVANAVKDKYNGA